MIKEKFQAVKEHIQRNSTAYISVGVGVVSAGITFIIMRSIAKQHIDRGISVVADRGIP